MSKQEKIVCAAVRNWMGKSEYIVLYLHYPDYLTASSYQVGSIGYQKGFITNKNRFVDAREAVIIASHANQIHELTRLYAEYFEANDKDTHSYAKGKFSAYMDKLEEYKERGLKPEDLY